MSLLSLDDTTLRYIISLLCLSEEPMKGLRLVCKRLLRCTDHIRAGASISSGQIVSYAVLHTEWQYASHAMSMHAAMRYRIAKQELHISDLKIALFQQIRNNTNDSAVETYGWLKGFERYVNDEYTQTGTNNDILERYLQICKTQGKHA